MPNVDLTPSQNVSPVASRILLLSETESHNGTTEPMVLRFNNEPMNDVGAEEFKTSLMMHFALLMLMTAWFAWRGTLQILAKPIIPIHVIGPLSRPIIGSGTTLEEKPGSKLAMGVPKAISKGRKSTLRKNPGLAKAMRKFIKQSVQVAAPIEKPAMKQEASEMNKADGKAPDKPYVANIHPDEVDDVIMNPETSSLTDISSANQTSGDAKTGTQDLGEPLPLDEGLTSPLTAGTGSGDKADMPSGNIDAKVAAGGGEMEIGDIESLGGGSQRFESPKVISRVLPDYPEWARKKGVKGQAVYKVFIQQSGTVGDVLNMASTIDPQLAIIGSQALRRWVFSPVMVDGEPKETWVKVTVQFHLN